MCYFLWRRNLDNRNQLLTKSLQVPPNLGIQTPAISTPPASDATKQRPRTIRTEWTRYPWGKWEVARDTEIGHLSHP